MHKQPFYSSSVHQTFKKKVLIDIRQCVGIYRKNYSLSLNLITGNDFVLYHFFVVVILVLLVHSHMDF